MREATAGRTLVKSPPELWAVCSDADSLAQHLEAFGEIRITRLEPETTVAWEGERASGTVRIEPSGWGTKVTVTAAAAAPKPQQVLPEPERVAPEPDSVAPEPGPSRRPGFFARLFGGAHAPAPVPVVSEASVYEPIQDERPAVDAEAVLEAALDSLGQAHKRPFSR